jgi:hypothetical protein
MENKMKIKILILLTAIFIAQICLASALTISSVSSNPNEVQPGEKFTLELKIENNLGDSVENVIVSLTLNDKTNPVPFAPYQSSSEDMIDEINDGDDEKASFDLIALSDAISGTYTIPIQVSYRLDNGTQVPFESLGLVSVIINAKPKIDVSSEGSVLIKGTNGKISVKVINSGLGDSKFLSITLKQISGMKITNADKVYIGNIDSNDFDTAEFNVFVNTNAQSLINLPVELTYTDSRNNQITENKIISIKTYTAKEATELGLISKNNISFIIVSIVGLLVLFLIYRRIRKKTKNKRNGQ